MTANYFIESSFYWAIILLFYLILLRHTKHFGFNRFYLNSGLLLGLILPLIEFEGIQVQNQIIGQVLYDVEFSMTEINQNIAQINAPTKFSFSAFYLGFAFLLTLPMLKYFFEFINLSNQQNHKITKHIKVFYRNAIKPYSFINHIYIDPNAYDDTALHQIIQHEKCHIENMHSIDKIVFQLVAIIFWLNPIVYLWKNLINENHEYEVDHQMKNKFGAKKYSYLLLSVASGIGSNFLTNRFFNTSIKNRIIMINKHNSNQNANFFNISLSCLLLIGLSSFSFTNVLDDVIPKLLDTKTIFIEQAKEQLNLYPLESKNNIDLPETKDSNPVVASRFRDCYTTHKNGRMYPTNNGPFLPSCSHISNLEERAQCSNVKLRSYFNVKEIYTDEALKEGFQALVTFTLDIDKQGQIEGFDFHRPAPFGIEEAILESAEKMKNEIKFEPLECNGEIYKTIKNIAIRFSITDNMMPKVEVRDSRNQNPVSQLVSFTNVGSTGHIGFSYRSNMNRPVEIKVFDPEGQLIHTSNKAYMYKQFRDGFKHDNIVNGTYSIQVEQDGQIVKSTIDVNL